MGDKVTIYDIAKAAGVGIATVSRVLNGDTHVRPSTRAAVQDAISALGYRPSRAARRLAQGHPSRPRVAALVPFFTAAFYFAVTRSLAHGLKASDIDLVIHDIKSRDDKNRILDRILSERACEGIVLISCGIGPERIEQLERLGVPAVCADSRCEGLPSVSIDNAAGGHLAAQHLRDAGCRKPALIAGPNQASTLFEREQAFIDKLQLSDSGLAVPIKRAGAVGQEAGKVAVLELMEEQGDVDGLFCVNDMLAVGALE
ncbi:MAG: LacI family DNA-binding transcriptional regulator, partial [Planctomycetota bacterium]|nr:LacI family DNA-binding transcriptional regulator [Planctomycetota bacterium]